MVPPVGIGLTDCQTSELGAMLPPAPPVQTALHYIDEAVLAEAAEVYSSTTRWNSAISSWLSVLPGIVADSDRRWAIKVDTLGSFAP